MEKFDLDTTLIEFVGKSGRSNWTIRDAVEGVQIFGGIGSGKTSASGRLIALKYLSNQFGGLVLTAKADEKEMWQEYCLLANRLKDLFIIEPGGKHFFNFLEFESTKIDTGDSITGNLVQVLKTVIKASEDKDSDKGDDSFWETALDMLMFNVIDLCMLAYGSVSVQRIFDIVLSAPKKIEYENAREKSQSGGNGAFDHALRAAKHHVEKEVQAWKKTLTQAELDELEDDEIFEMEMLEAVPSTKLLRFIDQFFIDNYRSIGEKTRAIIEFSFTGLLFRLMQEPFYTLFCRYASTVTPDSCLDGKIILLNLPVKQYNKVGRDIQIMFKYIFQRRIEKRQVKVNGRPVFLWADEAQLFLHENDAETQATARSSRLATVYISQNLPNYYANMGGNKSEFKVKSFLGTLGTKIFHANADIETNRYASDLIGEAYVEDKSSTVTSGQNFSFSDGTSFKLEKMVRPEQFVGLKTGGKLNFRKVEGYIHRQGRPFQTGANFDHITFQQSN